MYALGSKDMGPDDVNEWLQGCRGGAHPVCEPRYIEIDAFASIDVALAIERQV